jgi:hypothetical protein
MPITIDEKLFLTPLKYIVQIKMSLKINKGLLLTIALTVILLFVYYGKIISNADKISFNPNGDGFKNYFTVAYYLKYDSGSHFSGMLYPYGENVLFTDNQPFVSWILKVLSFVFPSITDHVHGILTILIFGSIVLAAMFLFKTLKLLKIDDLIAAIFAVLIAMLSPQIDRIHCHFSLSYMFFVPAIIYYLIKYLQNTNNYRPLFIITLISTCFAFIHIYYAAMAGLFIFSIAASNFVFRRSSLLEKVKTSLLLALTGAIPIVVLKLFLFITDKVPDRPALPWGFIETRSTISNIFLHQYTYTTEFLQKYFPNLPIVFNPEGVGYIGLIAVIILLFTILSIIYHLILKRAFYLAQHKPFDILLPAAGVVLLFAMAFPFCIDSFEKYYSLLPSTIKQFRASGRFNWIFYYTITLFSAVVCYNVFSYLNNRKKYLGIVFLTMVIAIWFVDVNMVSVRESKKLFSESVPNTESEEKGIFMEGLKKAGRQTEDFQAIIPIPFFLNGSEKLYIEFFRSDIGMKTALYTGLPLVCGQLSRTSQKLTFEIANLLSVPFIKKNITKQYNNKPLLMAVVGDVFSDAEIRLKAKGKYLFENNGVWYYELPISAFSDSTNEIKKAVLAGNIRLIEHGSYLSDDSLETCVVKSFDDNDSYTSFFGKGSNYNPEGISWLYGSTIPNAKDETTYEVSAWFYSDKRRPAYPVLTITQVDSLDNEISKDECNPKFSTNTFGEWVYVSTKIVLKNRTNRVYVATDGSYATVDELMIRPTSTRVVSHKSESGTFLYNNFPIE